MPELTPLDDNRQEHFLNGEDLEPITRREHFYAGRESELPAGHQEPETREEWFIQKYRGGGGDVTVVPLSVTDNGTYSEEGKAYSPVNVNIPLPQNAYLLKSVTTPTPIASFSDGEEMVMPSLKVAIEPQQEGSGDPSPTNVRPISGWSSVGVTRCGKNVFNYSSITIDDIEVRQSAQTVTRSGFRYNLPKGTYTISCHGTLETYVYGVVQTSNDAYVSGFTLSTSSGDWRTPTITLNDGDYIIIYKALSGFVLDLSRVEIQIEIGTQATAYEPYNGHTYTIDLGDTRYGGTLDVVSGVLTVDWVTVTLNGSESWDNFVGSGVNQFYTNVASAKSSNDGNIKTVCDKFKSISINNRANNYNTCYTATNVICFNVENYTIETWKTWLASNNVQLVYELATPITIQLTPTAVKSLLGDNNISADTGNVLDAEYFSKEAE